MDVKIPMNIVEDFVSYFFFLFCVSALLKIWIATARFSTLYTHAQHTQKKWGSIEHFKEVKKAIVSILFAAPGARVRFYQFFFFQCNWCSIRIWRDFYDQVKKKKQQMQRANYGK